MDQAALTLEEWRTKFSKYQTECNGCVVVYSTPGSPGHNLLWRLEDYIVSSSRGGVFWLVPKQQPGRETSPVPVNPEIFVVNSLPDGSLAIYYSSNEEECLGYTCTIDNERGIQPIAFRVPQRSPFFYYVERPAAFPSNGMMAIRVDGIYRIFS